MTRFLRALILPTLSATVISALPCQTRMPAHAIAQLRPFVGNWRVEQVLVRPGGRADTTHLNSVIEFSADTSILIVRESTSDGRFHFVGYHTYEPSTSRFVNWGADSYQTLGWAKGRADEAALRYDGVVRFLATGDTLAYHGYWHVASRHQHIYEATGVDAGNRGQMLKRDVYTRVETR